MESWEIILLMLVGTFCVALIIVVWAAMQEAKRKASTRGHNDAQAGVNFVSFDEYAARVANDKRVNGGIK